MTHYLVGDTAYPDHNAPAAQHGTPVLVINPKDIKQVERLRQVLNDEIPTYVGHSAVGRALLQLVVDPKPEEPTDPKARVTDRRENIWRLLADGDWVCTSGPDIGEYLVWWQLLDRGPLSIEGVTS